MPLPPLLETPTFPVYGLTRDFHAYRWMILWNDPHYIRTVSLGHGHPDEGRWIDVTTERDSRQRWSSEGIRSPILLKAALNAITRLLDLNGIRGRAAPALLNREMELLQTQADGTLNLFGWDPTSTRVDAKAVSSYARTVGKGWAVILDLGLVAVSVTGPADQPPKALALEDVSTRLHLYERLP